MDLKITKNNSFTFDIDKIKDRLFVNSITVFKIVFIVAAVILFWYFASNYGE